MRQRESTRAQRKEGVREERRKKEVRRREG